MFLMSASPRGYESESRIRRTTTKNSVLFVRLRLLVLYRYSGLTNEDIVRNLKRQACLQRAVFKNLILILSFFFLYRYYFRQVFSVVNIIFFLVFIRKKCEKTYNKSKCCVRHQMCFLPLVMELNGVIFVCSLLQYCSPSISFVFVIALKLSCWFLGSAIMVL